MFSQEQLDRYGDIALSALPRDILFEECLWLEDDGWIYGESYFYRKGVEKVLVGASKLVLLLEDQPFVVKIPLRGTYEEEDEREYKHDYCKIESNLYREAIDAGIDDMFAGTYYVGDFSGEYDSIPVYISERAEFEYSFSVSNHSPIHPHPSKAGIEYEEGKDEVTENPFDEDGILAEFYTQYGNDKTEALLRFIKDFLISDLHGENIAYDKSNRLKLIDYSGFFE